MTLTRRWVGLDTRSEKLVVIAEPLEYKRAKVVAHPEQLHLKLAVCARLGVVLALSYDMRIPPTTWSTIISTMWSGRV